jgi:N-acetylglucosamine kinase-like BadF-type ATPase
MEYVLGVDGGNSKTIALIASLDGSILGAGRSGCGDIYKGVDRALSAVDEAVRQAREQSNCKAKRSILTSTFSMAGADYPEDFALLRISFRKRSYGRRITVVNDAVGALRAGSVDGSGVAIVCGTGAATSSRSPDSKRLWHSSFWQQGGGAASLGRQARDLVFRAELGLVPPTALTKRLLEHFGHDSVEGLNHAINARWAEKPVPMHKLARAVLDCAHAGDESALAIVRNEARLLGETAVVAAAKVGFDDTATFPLVFAGSVFRHDCRLLAKLVTEHVKRERPFARPLMCDLEPSAGAVIMALEKAGVVVDSAIRANVVNTLPPRSFFAT